MGVAVKLSRMQRVFQMERKIVEALIANKSHNQIALDLRVGKRRIGRIRWRAEAAGYLSGVTALPPFPEALFAANTYSHLIPGSDVDLELIVHKDWIRERLAIGWTPISVFEELPIKVGRSSFYRFLKRHHLDRVGEDHRWATPEIRHQPGEALLVDWGKLCSAINPKTGKRQTLWAFVGVLGYSRYIMVRLMWTCDSATTLAALGGMFLEMGGVPKRLTSDNPKVFCLEASRYEALLNPVYERFAAHYNTTIECLPPRDPEKKGKVERPMPYVRRLSESFAGDKGDVAAFQSFMERKLVIANDRKHGTTLEAPLKRLLEEEVHTLKALPAMAYEQEEFHEGVVRQDNHVRFRDKYYSVDGGCRGQTVQIIGSQAQVKIYFKGKLEETHDRVWARDQSKSTKEHHMAPWTRAMEDTSYLRLRAQEFGPFTDAVITHFIAKGNGLIDFRRVWGVLSLGKSASRESVEDACRKAIETGEISFRGVRAFLVGGGLAGLGAKGLGGGGTNKFVRPVREYEEFIASQTFKEETGEKYEQQHRGHPSTIH